MDEIVWQDPPPAHNKRGKGAAQLFVAELQKRPGQWALYPKSMASPATSHTYRKTYPSTEWTLRRREDGRYDLYGRWLEATS